MESEEEKLPQDRWYWGWYGIFLALLGISPFVPPTLGIPCGVIGIGGLLIQMREGFKARISRIRQIHLSRAQILAFMRVAAVVMLGILGIKTIALVFQINNAVDTYVMPRRVTDKQANNLREYLSHHEAHAITVKVNPFDQEADGYAMQLFSALRTTDWDVKFDTSNEPIPNTLTAGLCIQIVGSLPDPKHDPETLIKQALEASHIRANCGGSNGPGEYKLFLTVGHRPVELGPEEEPMLHKLGRWIQMHT